MSGFVHKKRMSAKEVNMPLLLAYRAQRMISISSFDISGQKPSCIAQLVA
jgi:hypothetical protein